MATPEEIIRITWLSLGGSLSDGTADLVLRRHAEGHRRYHTAEHVMWVLDWVERLLPASPATDGAAVRAAALFHDVVYDPRSSASNEAESADLAVHALASIGWTSPRLDVVRRLILATAGHEADGPDAAILLDADLAVLGAPPADYAGYVEAVRFEYGFVSEPDWRVGRAAVLRSFLDREHVYATNRMRAEREPLAQSNLRSELAMLTDT
jgi:predicted metal-dependent HD superfamily phosphohydrolase